MTKYVVVTLLLVFSTAATAAPKPIAPHFSMELEAAGLLGLPFSWGADGTFNFDPSMSTAQIAAVQAVYTAHDPTDTVKLSQFKDLAVSKDFDQQKLMLALAIWTRQKINELRALHSLGAISAATQKSEVLTIYKGL